MDNKIIAFAGSNSSDSINEQLVNAAVNQLPHEKTNYVDLKKLDIPMYSKDLESTKGIPKPIKKLYQRFTKAEGFIIASPEHNGLIPAFFKNVIDWLTRIDQKIFMDKPVLLLSASPGEGGGRTNLSILSETMPFWGAEIIDTYSLGNFHEVFDTDTQSITDAEEINDFNAVLKKFTQKTLHLSAVNYQ